MATRYYMYNILITLEVAKLNCYCVDKSVIFGMMFPCDLIFNLGLGTNLKKSNMAAIFKMDTRNYEVSITS